MPSLQSVLFQSPSPSPAPSPSPVPAFSAPQEPAAISSGEDSSESEQPDSIDDADGNQYFFQLPAAPPGFPPPEGYPSSAADLGSYIAQGALATMCCLCMLTDKQVRFLLLQLCSKCLLMLCS